MLLLIADSAMCRTSIAHLEQNSEYLHACIVLPEQARGRSSPTASNWQQGAPISVMD
jgi:hypothetical protein